MEGRRLRLFFPDGDICEGQIVSVPAHDSCDGCNGFVYDLIATTKPERYAQMNVKVGDALWTRFEDLQGYEMMEGESK